MQLVTNWILYNIWEARYDARSRAYLRGQDSAYSSLKAKASKAGSFVTYRAIYDRLRGLNYAPISFITATISSG